MGSRDGEDPAAAVVGNSFDVVAAAAAGEEVQRQVVGVAHRLYFPHLEHSVIWKNTKNIKVMHGRGWKLNDFYHF